MSTRKSAWLKLSLCGAATIAIAAASSYAHALDRPILGTNAMISAGHPLAVNSGLKALQAGGTACDAAVAVAATLSVVMTDMMGPLGSGYALVYDASNKKLDAIDFNGVAPQKTDPKNYTMEEKRRGIKAPTVPGALMGWEEIHKKCGKLAWADLWKDAIDLAENGRPLDVDTAFHIRRHVPEMGINPTWAKEFLIDGKPGEAGAILKRPDLAATYKLFAAEGSKALYQGKVGAQLVAYMSKEGGLITQDDLTKYKVKWLEPIKSSYRGYDVYGAPPNSSAITWMQILNILEGYDLKALGLNSPEYLRRFIEASKFAYEDAYKHNGDPAFVEVPVAQLLNKDYASKLRATIDQGGVRQYKPAKQAYAYPRETNHSTSHMSIIDKAGNAISMTNTHGTFFGSGLVVEGTGLLLSNGMDWFDIDLNIWTGERPGKLAMAPGKRNRWTLSPGMLFRDGKLYMVPGGAGAEATMWGLAQPIVNVIDFGMDPQKALASPRFRYGDIYHYTGGTQVYLDPGMDPGNYEALGKMGYQVQAPGEQPRNPSRGTTNMVVVDPKSGVYWGAAAPDGRDFVAGY
jgi:gamma-glutamyltranspeptidase/glutathione hydrolase